MSNVIYLAAEVSEAEAKQFEEHCEKLGVNPAEKLAELIANFVFLRSGVKHLDESAQGGKA